MRCLKLHSGWLACLLGLWIGACTEKPPAFEELTDEERRQAEHALDGLTWPDDVSVSLFAHEPLMINPTNIDVDAKGRVWVCEAYNYRPHLNPENPYFEPGDRILILEDHDQDGKADSRKVFYMGPEINAALGIAVLGNRVIVSCSPHVFVFTDEDGDDQADKKEILFTGISGVQHDHGMHAFVFGPDGKLYFNYGNAGGQLLHSDGSPVVTPYGELVKADGKPFQQGMVFRCNPDGSEVEVLGHNFRNNYELAVDAFGTIWQSDNDDDGNRGVRINYVMEFGNFGYRDELTGAGWRDYRTGWEDSIPYRHWHLNDPGVVPNLLQTGAGSPTGLVVYEGGILPERYAYELIHADAGPNVVRAYPVHQEGAGYSAQIEPLVQGKDQWFRPSDVTVAPDGSLFIADWYDPGVGGHAMGDQQRGRIFRVTRNQRTYKSPAVDTSTVQGAVALLLSPNMAARYLGWQSLGKKGPPAMEALAEVYENDANIHRRARAFWFLVKHDDRPGRWIMEGSQSKVAELRITALRAARQVDELNAALLRSLAVDPDPAVRREVALAIRHWKGGGKADIWAVLAQNYPDNDRWYLEALGIGARGMEEAALQAYLALADTETKAFRDIIWRMRAPQSLPYLVQFIRDSKEVATTYRYFRAFDFHDQRVRQPYLVQLANDPEIDNPEITFLALYHMDDEFIINSPALRRRMVDVLSEIEDERQIVTAIRKFGLPGFSENMLELAADEETDPVLAAEAIYAITAAGDLAMLRDFILTAPAQKVNQVTQVMRKAPDNQQFEMLKALANNKALPYERRLLALEPFRNNWAGEHLLIEYVKQDQMQHDLDSVMAAIFMNAWDKTLAKEAALYIDMPEMEKSQSFPPISQMVAMKGDATQGQTVFQTTGCAACHQVNGEGVEFGPNLTQIGSKLPKTGLYAAIMQPSQGISFGYEGVTVTLDNGEVVQGYVASETEDELVIRMMGGVDQRVTKEAIKQLQQHEESLMTNQTTMMDTQQLVDLVAYLGTLK